MSGTCRGLQRAAGSARQASAVPGWPSARVVAPLRSAARHCPPVRASQLEPASATPPGSSGPLNPGAADEQIDWTRRGVPAYLQSSADIDVCDEESKALTMGLAGNLLWNAIRSEAQADAASEPLLSSFLYASILAHDSFELSLAFVLANRLANSTMLPTQLFEIFHSVLRNYPDVRCASLSDMAAFRERDPACTSYSYALLYYKGYHALQTHRVAHALWNRGQRVMALALQSRISEVFAVDIHPAARIGKGVLLDHGTGVVIGETAVIGNNVSILQNVTLGGTGKDMGDRHPKVGDNVLIGACATVLGNISIGKGAQIAAGSLVLKPVPPHTLVAGSPAKEVGPVVGNPALSMVHWSKRLLAPEEAGASREGQGRGGGGAGAGAGPAAGAATAAAVTKAEGSGRRAAGAGAAAEVKAEGSIGTVAFHGAAAAVAAASNGAAAAAAASNGAVAAAAASNGAVAAAPLNGSGAPEANGARAPRGRARASPTASPTASPLASADAPEERAGRRRAAAAPPAAEVATASSNGHKPAAAPAGAAQEGGDAAAAAGRKAAGSGVKPGGPAAEGGRSKGAEPVRKKPLPEYEI